LLDFVQKNRLSILQELAGLVLRWKQQGLPKGKAKHRCTCWAEIIGGILSGAGLNNFFAKVWGVEASMDEGLVRLTALAEHVEDGRLNDYFGLAGSDLSSKGMPASDWVSLFAEADIARDQLANKNAKGKSTWVGTFLGAKINRTVAIATALGHGTASLRL